MSEERIPSMEATIAELEHALWAAIKGGIVKDKFQWSQVIDVGDDGDPWYAVLTVGKVESNG
jgi:hypothetical protein